MDDELVIASSELEATRLYLEEEVERVHALKSWLSPVEELLWARLRRLRTDLAAFVIDLEFDPVKARLYEQCVLNLDLAQASIERWGIRKHRRGSREASDGRTFRSWPFCENYSLFWTLVHIVQQDLLQIAEPQYLLNQCEKLRGRLARCLRDRDMRRYWLGDGRDSGELERIHRSLHWHVALLSGETCRSTRHDTTVGAELTIEECRCELREAMGRIFGPEEASTRQSAFNILIINFSAVLLAAVVVPALLLFVRAPHAHLTVTGSLMGMFALFGAAGAYVSNMLKKEPFVALRGPARRYMVMHLVTRPALSAFAGLLFGIIIASHLVFDFHVPSDGAWSGQLGAITIPVRNTQAQLFAYSAFAIAAGFASDKLLRSLLGTLVKRLESRVVPGEQRPRSPD